jgi:predicted small lipoprotein YifL
MRSLVLALLSLSLTGCGQIEALFLSPGEKINRAFPPSAEVRATAEDLQSLAGTDTPAGNELAAQYGARLDHRGVTCAQGLMITRLNTVEQVREQPVSRDCLNTQDSALLEFLQIRQVGWRLGLPPLRPLKPLGEPQISSPGLPIFSGIAASSAGVAVVMGTNGDLLTLQIPGGETIAKLPRRQEAGLHDARLSPNGRVLALASGYSNRVHEFIDSETGAVLWKTERLNSFLTWLPTLSAGLADNREGQLTVIDFQAGEARPGTSDLKRQTWATPLTAGSSRIAVGNLRDIRVIDYQRTPAGVKGEIVKHFKFSHGGGVTSGKNPTAMQGGKSLLLFSDNDLMTVDLESEQETHWKTDRLIASDYAKLSESSVLVDVHDSPMKRSPWVLNLEESTIAPVSTEAGSEGILYELEGRTGFLRREHDGIWFGDRLQQGEPQAFNDFLGARNLEKQIAKLNSMTQANAAEIAAPSNAPTHLDLSPAPAPASQETRITANPPALTTGQFALQAKGARVEAIGVYESSKPLPQGPGNQPGQISVDIPPSSQPRVLVLSSYESVRWKLNPQPGSQIKLILTSSYYPSFVEGAGSIPVVPITATYAYERDSKEYGQLTSEVQRLTLRPIATFQGGYSEEHFILGSQ